MFFLSSPPQPPPTQHQFFNNPFTFRHGPTTPSPLRTSYNANGIKRTRMSPPKYSLHSLSSPITNSADYAESDNENDQAYPTTALTTTTTLPTAFSFSSPARTTTTNTVQSTHYANRARASTPTALLNTHANTRKAETRARFLDRIRTRRDEGFGRDDKILRADYLNERQAWEAEMRRRAVLDGIDAGLQVDEEEAELDHQVDEAQRTAHTTMDLGEDLQEEQQLSPTEEKELEALLEQWSPGGSTAGNHNHPNPHHDDHAGMYIGHNDDSQEWDEVFMEVLSQEEVQLIGHEGLTPAGDARQGGDGEMDVEMS